MPDTVASPPVETVPPTAMPPTATVAGADYSLFMPTHVSRHEPLQILVTVHGMGGTGSSFCENLLTRAEANGWAVLSPTFLYQNYHDPALVREDDARVLPRLKQIIDALPEQTGATFKPTVLLYGFSRGAQVVHRFAEWYPERVEAVALFSAGSYTLPYTTMTIADGAAQNMAFPYGVADIPALTGGPFNTEAFRRVRFFVGVGGMDVNGAETPRAWDATLGLTRVGRAQTFADSLRAMHVDATFAVFPGVGHDVTAEMRGTAMAFLEAAGRRG